MAVTSKDGKFPMVLEVRAQGVKETFRNGQDLIKFFEKEVMLWREVVGSGRSLTLFNTNMASVCGHQAVVDAAHLAVEAGRRVESEAAYLSALKRFDDERTILMSGRLGKLIADQEGATEHQTAGLIWAAATSLGTSRLTQVHNQVATSQDLAAISFGQNKLNDGLHPLRTERSHVEALVLELQDHLSEAKANNEAASTLFQTATDELGTTVSEHNAEIAELTEETERAAKALVEECNKQVSTNRQEAQQALAEALRRSVEELDDFKRKVRIDVGLEEPTNFWTDKANGHRTAAIIFGLAFLASVVGMVWWIESSAVSLVAEAVDRIVGDRQAAALSLVPIAFITVPALAFAWVLRHLSRIIIQNLSLEADARLRGTITRTFKALAADRAMNDAELAIALQALFRPIDGKDHSEIAPPSLGDILKMGGDSKV